MDHEKTTKPTKLKNSSVGRTPYKKGYSKKNTNNSPRPLPVKPNEKNTRKTPTSKSPARKNPAKTPTRKTTPKSPTRKTTPKSPTRKSTVSKSPVRKTTVSKSPVRKPPTSKSPTRKTTTKSPTRKTTTKLPTRKTTVSKSPTRKTTVSKSPVRKTSTVSKSPVRKTSTVSKSPVKKTSGSPKNLRSKSISNSDDAKNQVTPFKKDHKLTEEEREYCSCLLKVSRKMSPDCLQNKKWGKTDDEGNRCYNPYGTCGKNGGSNRKCGMYYDFENFNLEQLKAYVFARKMEVRNSESKKMLLEDIQKYKKEEYGEI